MTSTAPPSPAAATDETAFVAELRRLKTWSGLSFRQLERSATDSGDLLPSSTAATMLNKNRLPRAEVVAAFVRACGVDDVRPWLLARTRIADGTAPHPISPRGRLSRWRRAVVAAAVLAVTFTAGTALDGVVVHEDEIDVEVVSP